MPAPITTPDMIAELRRELAMRERVYPAWYERGTLKREQGERQVAVLRAVLARIEETMSHEEVRQLSLPRA